MTFADRVSLLHKEIERLAHASPPPADREAAIRLLKARVSVLRREQYGLGTRPLEEGVRQVTILAVIALLVGVVRPVVAAAFGHAPQSPEVATFLRNLALAWAMSAVYVFLWVYWKRWRETRAVREALAYTDGLQHRLNPNGTLREAR